MFRFLTIIIGFILFASVFRWVMSFLKNAISDESPSQARSASTGTGSPRQQEQPRPQSEPAGNELKKCAACGIYSPVNMALTAKSAKGDMIYFCSNKCHAQHAA